MEAWPRKEAMKRGDSPDFFLWFTSTLGSLRRISTMEAWLFSQAM